MSTAAAATPTSNADRTAIQATLLDYIESWYAGDASRTERAVHPDLAKRIVEVGRDGREFVEHMGAMELVQNTRRGSGLKTPAAEQQKTIEIHAVHGNIASAAVTASAWVDYLHLARVNGSWRIVNALWAFKNPA